MKPSIPRAALAFLLASLASGCSTVGPLYPPRPSGTAGAPMVDVEPSRVVVHATITNAGLSRALDEALPRSGRGVFSVMGSERTYVWRRGPIKVRFTQGRVGVELSVAAQAHLPLKALDLPFDVHILAEPVLTSDYVGKLQSAEVKVTTDDGLLQAADSAADVLEKIRGELQGRLENFAYDARPSLEEAYMKLAAPIDLPMGDASACAVLHVMGVEAGPTVLADGIEKDIAMVIAPSVTLPCAEVGPPRPLPPLANVATIQPGPFTVKLAVAARYEELSKAMSVMFTDGKYFFSKQFPEAYMEQPEVYAAQDKVVLKLRIAGPVSKLGFDTMLDGDIFMTGTPVVEDNELKIPDLEPTFETSNFLLKLKAAVDGSAIRDQARAALRLDVSQRLASVREKLSNDLSIRTESGCMKAEVAKIEVTSVHAHGSYLRIYVNVTGKASAYLPCPD